MKIIPLQNRLLVQREGVASSTGSLIIPLAARTKATRGEVVTVGAGKIEHDGSRRKVDIKVGQTVMFGKYDGTEIIFGDEEMILVREDDVMAILEEVNEDDRRREIMRQMEELPTTIITGNEKGENSAIKVPILALNEGPDEHSSQPKKKWDSAASTHRIYDTNHDPVVLSDNSKSVGERFSFTREELKELTQEAPGKEEE